MTLKEKFIKPTKKYSSLFGWIDDLESAKECEIIADEFAIGFADWVRVCKLKQRPYDFDNIKELLEIYKDEKGL